MQEEEYLLHTSVHRKRRTAGRDCTLRKDDTGIINSLKANYLYAFHAAFCAVFTAIMFVLIDGSDFSTGSRTGYSAGQSATRLYQTEVNGLMSIALVLVRILAGSATILLAWRWVFVLLDKCGLTLAELLRLVEQRLPLMPRFESRTQLLWSSMTVLVVLLSWPPSLSAPLANSSLAWIPSGRLTAKIQAFNVASMNGDADWRGVVGPNQQQQTRAYNMLRTNAMAAGDPEYAYNDTALPMRRVFALNQTVPVGSTADLIVPFLDVTGIRWIDAGDGFPSIGDFSTTSITDLVNTNRAEGTVALYREKMYNVSAAPVPPMAELFNGTRVLYVRVAYLTTTEGYMEDAPCPILSPWLGLLPNVKQHEVRFYNDPPENKIFGAKDCYIVGEATILAGQYAAQNCNITESTTHQSTATCFVNRLGARPLPDTRTNYTIESISETMRNMMPLRITTAYMKLGLEAYTIGMLRVAYHASWSSTTESLSQAEETALFNILEPVVRASVNRPRLYAWLCMNMSLSICAVFVGFVQRNTKTKRIRSAALAAVTIDLGDLCLKDHAPGLCNAVALNSKDRELQRLVWKSKRKSIGIDEDGNTGTLLEQECERK